MAQGRPKKWVTATIAEPVALGKTGITVVVWDKWGKTRKGTLIVSVGGLRWNPYKTKKPSRMSWERFATLIETAGRI